MTTQLCECGCGEPAPLAEVTRKRDGWVKGEPRRFITGHQCAVNGRKSPGLGRPPGSVEPYKVRACGYSSPCWVWLRAKTRHGYGSLWVGAEKRLELAHRVYFETHVRRLEQGEHLHHLCGEKSCVNPGHLEVVDRKQHAERHLRSVCGAGHPLEGDNLYWRPDGKGRACRECRARADRRHYQARAKALS